MGCSSSVFIFPPVLFACRCLCLSIWLTKVKLTYLGSKIFCSMCLWQRFAKGSVRVLSGGWWWEQWDANTRSPGQGKMRLFRQRVEGSVCPVGETCICRSGTGLALKMVLLLPKPPRWKDCLSNVQLHPMQYIKSHSALARIMLSLDLIRFCSANYKRM